MDALLNVIFNTATVRFYKNLTVAVLLRVPNIVPNKEYG